VFGARPAKILLHTPIRLDYLQKLRTGDMHAYREVKVEIISSLPQVASTFI
jgi:hypothetical protein